MAIEFELLAWRGAQQRPPQRQRHSVVFGASPVELPVMPAQTHKLPDDPSLHHLARWATRHRRLFIAAVVIAVVASVVYSATQQPTYTAQATAEFQDPSVALGLVGGLPANPVSTPDQLAAQGAQAILDPRLAAAVKRALHSPLSARALLRSVTATPQPTTNLVLVQATGPSAAAAQDRANTFANKGTAAANAKVRREYATDLTKLRRHPPPTGDITGRQLYAEQLNRFEALSTVAAPAQVIDAAHRPTAPTSPRPLRNGILAAILGLIVAVLVALIRDSLDRRLRAVSEIANHFNFPLLGQVRTEALGRSPRLNGDQGVTAVDWELFRILRRNLDFIESGSSFRTVAVTSSLPEEGKSTVAMCLAFASAAAGKRTLLLECDLRRPVFASRLQIKPSPGLTDFVIGDAQPADILQLVRFGDPVSVNGIGGVTSSSEHGSASDSSVRDEQFAHGVVCVSAGTPTSHPIEILRSDRFRDMLDEMRLVYDLVVLDTPPLLSVADTLELLPNVDAAVICVRMLRATRQQASAGIAALGRLPARPTGLVVTGTSRGDEEEYGYYGYYGNRPS